MLHLDQFDARASPFVPAAVRSHCPGPRRSTTSALRGEKFPFLVDRNERFRQNLYLREVKPYLWAALIARISAFAPALLYLVQPCTRTSASHSRARAAQPRFASSP
jgi:hypothetical protein